MPSDNESKDKVPAKKVITHVPGGGNVKIFNKKTNYDQNAKSKIGSRDNEKHVAEGGKTKIFDKKPVFAQNAKARIISGMGTPDELKTNKQKVTPVTNKMTTVAEITKPLNRTMNDPSVKKVSISGEHGKAPDTTKHPQLVRKATGPSKPGVKQKSATTLFKSDTGVKVTISGTKKTS